MIQAEYETKLNKVYLHLIVDKEYEEDYQMPMLRQNQIAGILAVQGCSVSGKARYTYEIGGFTSMKQMHEKTAVKKQTILEVIFDLLSTIESLQEYMLNPNCLLLEPEYVFYHAGRWYFCYFPEMEEDLGKSFHRLTEYFVKTLDYGDVDGIFLAYELHKATLQEHYDLKRIMEEYKQHELERRQAERDSKEYTQRFGNVFCLTDGDNRKKEDDRSEEEQMEEYVLYKGRKIFPAADVVREENGWWGTWKTAAKRIRGRRWGMWDDLILESEEPPGDQS